MLTEQISFTLLANIPDNSNKNKYVIVILLITLIINFFLFHDLPTNNGCFFHSFKTMKHFNQDSINKQNERINCLLAELNSTLDLYYESVVDNDVVSNEQ